MKNIFKLVLGLVLAGVLLWWFFRDVDLESVAHAVGEARWGWLGACLALTLLHYLVRAWRWRLLLHPLKRGIPIRLLVEGVLAGYAVSFTLPGRLGELVRPALVARRERLSMTGTLATVGVDRLLDGATLTVFLVIFLILAPGTANGIPPEVVRDMRLGGFVVGGGMATLLVVLSSAALYRRRLPALRLDGSWRDRALGMLRSTLEALSALHGVRPLAGAILGSLLIWLVLAAQAWSGILAFGIDLPFTFAFGLIAVLAVGIAIPTPAGAGGFHAAGGAFLILVYGVNESQAVAAILVLHLISVVPSIILGGVVLAREGVSLGELVGRRTPDMNQATAEGQP
ncbi:MAG: lysylphosphatidylglycerol synthase transmembrane domain-containing protein [Acidobacteria bacterium]|nr:lysylphosphatidylglycerol synthase transmembrane domain-containing protein [Acidobacteriota bacterium]